MLSESLCLRWRARQEIDNSFHHPRGITLTRMHPGTNKYSFFCHSFRTFGVSVLARYREIFTPVACKSSCQSATMEKVLSWHIFFNPRNVVLQIRIGVGKTMRKKLIIIIVTKSVLKSETIKIPGILSIIPFKIILEVVYSITHSVPPDALLIFDFVWKIEKFHTIIIKWIRFG